MHECYFVRDGQCPNAIVLLPSILARAMDVPAAYVMEAVADTAATSVSPAVADAVAMPTIVMSSSAAARPTARSSRPVVIRIGLTGPKYMVSAAPKARICMAEDESAYCGPNRNVTTCGNIENIVAMGSANMIALLDARVEILLIASLSQRAYARAIIGVIYEFCMTGIKLMRLATRAATLKEALASGLPVNPRVKTGA